MKRPKGDGPYYLAMLYRVGDEPFEPLVMACLDSPSRCLTLSTGQVVQFAPAESSVRGRSGRARKLPSVDCALAGSREGGKREFARRTNKC